MKDKTPLKIAFVSASNPEDKRLMSGSVYYMNRSLQKHCGNVYYIDPFNVLLKKFFQGFSYFTRFLFKKDYIFPSILLSKAYAHIIKRKLDGQNFDLIFAPFASIEMAFLKTEIPIIYVADATFALINDYYEGYASLLNLLKKEWEFLERSAIKKAALIMYSSEWAANSALIDYDADESKVNVIPFGANIEKIPPKNVVLEKKKSSCNLLFLGVDWERKGGNIAFETLLELEKFGIDAKLTVCGCVPPKEFSHKRMTVIPFLDKNDEKQFNELYDLFLGSDFLLLPTRSEAYGIVFCEANAFGLPVITTDTGGIPSVITQGRNGFMLPMEANGIDYAKLIRKICLNDDLYFNLMRSSWETFEEKLNWDSWGISVSKIIAEYLDVKSRY
jgi:glycosyltransferase involved in cell wall biosynthesis